jgi:hypothetical protein
MLVRLQAGAQWHETAFRSRPVAIHRDGQPAVTLLEAVHAMCPAICKHGVSCRLRPAADGHVALALDVHFDTADGAVLAAVSRESDAALAGAAPMADAAVLSETSMGRSLQGHASGGTAQAQADTSLFRLHSNAATSLGRSVHTDDDATIALRAAASAAAANAAPGSAQALDHSSQGSSVAADSGVAASMVPAEAAGSAAADAAAVAAPADAGQAQECTPPEERESSLERGSAGEGVHTAAVPEAAQSSSQAHAEQALAQSAGSSAGGREQPGLASSACAASEGGEAPVAEASLAASMSQAADAGAAASESRTVAVPGTRAPPRIVRALLRPGIVIHVSGLRCCAGEEQLLWQPLEALYEVLRAPDLFLYVNVLDPS